MVLAERKVDSSMTTRQRLCLTAAFAAGVAVVLSMAMRSGFMHDDFLYLNYSKELGAWNEAYLSLRAFDHLAAAQRALAYLVFGKDHAHWYGAIAAMLFVQLTSMYCSFRLGRLIANPNWGIACAILMGMSPLWANCWIWYACLADMVFPMPATLLAFELFHRRLSGGSRWLSVGVGLTLLIALAGRERTAVIPASMLFWAVLLDLDANNLKSIAVSMWRTVLRLWDAWLAAVIAVGAYSAYFLTHGYLWSQFPGRGHSWSSSDPEKIAHFIELAFRNLLFPSLAGLLPTFYNGAQWPFVLSAIVVGGLILGSCLYFRHGIRMWVFVVASSALSLLPLAFARAGDIGLWGNLPRYNVEELPFLVLGVVFLGREALAGRVRFGLGLRQSTLHWAVAIYAIFFVGFSVASNHMYRIYGAYSFRAPVAQAFVNGVDKIDRGVEHTVLDSAIPLHLILGEPQEAGAVALLSNFIGQTRGDLKFADPRAKFVHTFDNVSAEHLTYERGKAVPLSPADIFVDQKALGASDGEFACVEAGKEPLYVYFRTEDPISLVQVSWRDAPEWVLGVVKRPWEVAEKFPIPAGISQHPTSLICDINLDSEQCGVKIPAGTKGCISSIERAPLRKVVL